MDKNELKHRLEAAEKQNIGLLDEIKNLKAKLAQMQDEPEIPDFPVLAGGEGYWYLSADLRLYHGCAVSGCAEFNYFHTEEYAQEFANKCKLIAMMLHCKWYLDRDYVPDWKNNEERKYFVCYDYVDGCFKYGMDHSFNGCSISFGTYVAARKCAEWLNRHWRDSDD